MKRYFVIPVGLLVITVIGFILGTAAQLPFVLVLSVLCAAPMALLSMGFAFGKASQSYSFFVPKDAPAQEIQYAPQQRRRQSAAGTYPVNSGDLRGS